MDGETAGKYTARLLFIVTIIIVVFIAYGIYGDSGDLSLFLSKKAIDMTVGELICIGIFIGAFVS